MSKLAIEFNIIIIITMQSSMEEREEIPEQKREAVELLASSNVVGGSYVPPHMRGQVGQMRTGWIKTNDDPVESLER